MNIRKEDRNMDAEDNNMKGEDLEIGGLEPGVLVEDRGRNPESDTVYKCPICRAKTKGRRGLNIHLRRKHFSDENSSGKHKVKSLSGRKDWSRARFDQKNELKIQSALVNAIYGSGKVNDVVRKYQNGDFTLAGLPINIRYYVKLLGVEPGQRKDRHGGKASSGMSGGNGRGSSAKDGSGQDQKIPRAEDLLNVLRRRRPDGSDWTDTVICLRVDDDRYAYVADLSYDNPGETLKISSTTYKEEALKESEAFRYLEEYDVETDHRNYVMKHGRSTVRRLSQRTDGPRRWIILGLTA